MKVELKENNKEVKFPCLMVSNTNECIVLFIDKHAGTVVYDPDCRYGVGSYDDKWNSHVFEPYNGSITLSND